MAYFHSVSHHPLYVMSSWMLTHRQEVASQDLTIPIGYGNKHSGAMFSLCVRINNVTMCTKSNTQLTEPLKLWL